MTKWVWTGLKTGKKTSAYPGTEETAPGVSPGRPADTQFKDEESARALADRCPAGALKSVEKNVEVIRDNCIHCCRCGHNEPVSMDWEKGYEWAEFNKTPGIRMADGKGAEGKGRDGNSEGGTRNRGSLNKAFSKSLNIRILDAGACGACMGEIKQITSPYYNIHRLGFFITPTPRMADILLVAGPLTEHMVDALEKTWDAMADPKRIIAVGTCAISGGLFGRGFASRKGISQTIPADIKVPGCPPPPLAIVHALLLAAGRQNEIPELKRGK